ncbi:hypothetical protein HYV79_01785 [Candidatus Woesearchaeota archaeon]|nr:hypothetical protein [Candidatus Woesearchaeota archaeon]
MKITKIAKKTIKLIEIFMLLAGCSNAQKKQEPLHQHARRIINGEKVQYIYDEMPEFRRQRLYFDSRFGLIYDYERYSQDSILRTLRDDPYKSTRLNTREKVEITRAFHQAFIYERGDIGKFVDKGFEAYEIVPKKLEKNIHEYFKDVHYYLIEPPEDSTIAPSISTMYKPVAENLSKPHWTGTLRFNYKPDTSVLKGDYEHALKTTLRINFESLRFEYRYEHNTDKKNEWLTFVSYGRSF